MEMDMAGFGDLLQQAEQLTADMDGDGEMPRVERNLRQIVDAGQQLWSRTTQTASKDTCDVRASILLGSKGFDLPKISQKLEGLSTTKTFEPIEPIHETDIQGFLKNERENAMLSVIEECKKTTFERADRLYWETMESEWEEEKHRILNALSGPTSDFLEVTMEAEPILRESVNMKTRSAMGNIEMAYAKEIYLYNEQIMQGGIKTKLAEKFHTVFEDLGDKKISELWEMVEYMIDIPLKSDKEVLAVRGTLLMQTSFIQQARKYLEKKYFEYMQAVVYANLKHASLGSRPGVFFLVQSFLKIYLPMHFKGLESTIDEDIRVWASVYFCLRCGNLAAAVESARTAGDRLSDFVPFLIEYMENEGRRLNSSSESQIKMEYKRYVRSSENPFKRAVYIILGCDTTDDVTDIVDKTTEDYLWRKLCQLYPDDEDHGIVHSDRMTLSMLQMKMFEEYGESHFNAYQQPFLYFQVLFLTAQFEAAIEFLSRMEPLRCHAVHVAIVLYEQNLLALPQSNQAPLLSKVASDKSTMRRLNLSRLIMMYTNKFEGTDPREALQYFYVLRELKGPRGVNLFMACVSELVLETREFEMLLGKIEADGCRKPGAIDRFELDTLGIIEKVAIDSETKGQYEDAIKLYDLARKHEKVLEVLNKLMSQVVPLSNTPGSNRQRLESIAIAIAERYRTQGHSASVESSTTFYILLDLMTFFNLSHNKQHQDALEAIRNLKLLPFEMDDVEHKVTAFSLYAEEVRRNFPDVLLATMNILYSEYKKAKQSTGMLHDQKIKDIQFKQEKYISYLRTLARALITFAGMIPYRMPGDTNAKLVQLEVMMN